MPSLLDFYKRIFYKLFLLASKFHEYTERFATTFLNLFRIGFFGAAQGWGVGKKAPIPKICHTYPTMMKPGAVIRYLKKFQKLYESCDTPLDFCWHQHFLAEIIKFCYIKKYRYGFHLDTYFLTFLTFLYSLRIVLINMVKILMMSAKMATPGLLKIKIFWKKAYYVIIDHDVTNTILSFDSNYNVNVVMWPKFGYSSISVREVIIYSIL